MPSNLDDVSSSAGRILDQQYKTKGSSIAERLPKLKRKLPRKARQAAETIAQAEYRAKYLPYTPQGDIDAANKAGKALAQHAQADDIAAARKIARKKWLYSLIINLGLMCVAIWVFWLIGSQ
jgi:hypothetical protein